MASERDSRNLAGCAPAAANEMDEREITTGFGRRISRLRKRRGWSQAELVQRLGVTRARLGNWERGQHWPQLKALLALRREWPCRS